MFDYLIIGSGAAGATIAYFLAKDGYKIAVVDQGKICSGGSSAAGAFLSPKISKPSIYKDFVNDALSFSLNFYQTNFPDTLHINKLLKIPKNEKDAELLRSYEPYMDNYTKMSEGYLFENAGIVDAQEVCKKMLQNVKVIENKKISKLDYCDGVWKAEDIGAKNIILAIGGYEDIVKIPYLQIRKIYGYRYDIKTDSQVDYNMHKEVSIAKTYSSRSAIGASYIRGKNITLDSIKQMAQEDSADLIDKALEIRELKNLKILKSYVGIRALTLDYFPILGQLIDDKKTLEKYPYIKTGSKVPSKLFFKYSNLYIHTGHGARAFVLAPYTAKLLYEYIINGKKMEKYLNIESRFLKWSRKIYKIP